MAFVSGSAQDIPTLLTAIQNACTANGWTLSGSVLHAGDCHVQLQAITDGISVLGGTGIDAGNALTTPGPTTVNLKSPLIAPVFDYPLTYFLHVFATEVYCIVRFSVDRYAYAAWGQSGVAGLPGTGVWYGASQSYNMVNGLSYDASAPYAGVDVGYNGANSTGLFWEGGDSSYVGSYLHHGLDGGGWSDATGGANGQTPCGIAKAMGGAGYLMAAYQPNAWNGEALLVPIQPYIGRPSSKVSICADLMNARYLRIDNYAPEDVITLGSDRWRVYPFFRKNAAMRNGDSHGGDHSGTLGWAVRYDGP